MTTTPASAEPQPCCLLDEPAAFVTTLSQCDYSAVLARVEKQSGAGMQKEQFNEQVAGLATFGGGPAPLVAIEALASKAFPSTVDAADGCRAAAQPAGAVLLEKELHWHAVVLQHGRGCVQRFEV